MKTINTITRAIAVLGVAGSCATSVWGQSSFSMQIVADNDFAVFGGTSSGINDLLYQNDASWPDQISNLSTLNFTLQSGDTMFYVLGMGGGGQENISGTINGVDMTTIDVSMSSDLSSYLTGYLVDGQPDGSVAGGSYNASLADVQAAYPNLTWGSPTINSSDNVIEIASPNGSGFHFDDSTAHLFTFDATAVGITPVPEPCTLALAGLGGASLLLFRRRK